MTAPKKPQTVNVAALNELGEFVLKSTETSEERASRLKREEAESDHKLRMQEAKEEHERWISRMAHVYVVAVLAVAFVGSSYITLTGDPKSGLTQSAMTVVTGIVTGGVGFIFGKGGK